MRLNGGRNPFETFFSFFFLLPPLLRSLGHSLQYNESSFFAFYFYHN